MHLIVNDALSVIFLIVAVRQLPINIVVVDKGDTMKLLAIPARNSQATTVLLLLLFLYCIESMLMLFVRSIAQLDEHESFFYTLESILMKFFLGASP